MVESPHTKPATGEEPFQVGVGGNGTNVRLGGQGWIMYSGKYNGMGDINVDLFKNCGDAPVPEPASAALLASGLAGIAVFRRRREKIKA